MELELHGGCLKKHNLNFSKKSNKKILDIDNFEIYNPAKSHFSVF
jgi:hypothetical protein